MEQPKLRARFSIVMKVSILAGSIAAVASFVVGSLIVSGSADIVYQNALDRLKYETSIKSLKLLSAIDNLSGDARYLVGTPPITGIPRALENNGIDPQDQSSLSTWETRLATIFSELIRAKSHYMQIRYIGIAGNGRELVRVDRKGEQIRVIAAGQLQEKGDTKYFKNAIRVDPGEVYLSDITLNREFGKISEPKTPVIRAATPVFLGEKLFGILVINMAFGDIFDELIRNTPNELVPYVANEEGYFLAHPNKDMTYGFDLGNENRIQNIYKDFDLKRGNDLRDLEFTSETSGDVVHVVKARYDPAQANRFFAVMQATSYENLQSGSAQLRYQSFTIMAALVVLSLVVAALLASRLMRPLQLISKASEDLAKGKDVLRLPLESADEIGELARSFDQMRCQLAEKERELIVSQGHVHHASKMASLGKMAAGMAHEINSPVQMVSLVAERVQRQLKKNMSAEEIDASMGKIISSVKKISEIIDSLRNVSRNSASDKFLDTKISDLMVDVKNMTEERFSVNRVKFTVEYHGVSGDETIQCQRLQISQVLINLVNNAYDAIQEDENKWIRVDISKAPGKILISVTDSGDGVPEDIAEIIFEPMFTTKEVGKGTGLGLSISSDITSKHNGMLYIDKNSDRSSFVIELPVRQVV